MFGNQERYDAEAAIWRIRSETMTPSRPMVPLAVLAAAFLFESRPRRTQTSMPIYLERTFAANYRRVTLIPVVFGAGKWIATCRLVTCSPVSDVLS